MRVADEQFSERVPLPYLYPYFAGLSIKKKNGDERRLLLPRQASPSVALRPWTVSIRLARHRLRPAGALAVRASRPTARPAEAVLQLLLRPANTAFSGR